MHITALLDLEAELNKKGKGFKTFPFFYLTDVSSRIFHNC